MKMIAKWNRPDNLFPVTLRGMDDLVHALFGRLNTEFSPEWMHDCGCEPPESGPSCWDALDDLKL